MNILQLFYFAFTSGSILSPFLTLLKCFYQKPIGGVAVLPSGGLFGKKKEKEGKENKDDNIPEQNGTDSESQLNSSAESEKKKPKVSVFINNTEFKSCYASFAISLR